MKCPHCGGDTVKRGIRKRLKKHPVQIYGCKICKKRFIRMTLNHRSIHPMSIITKALNYRQQGLSYREISDKLGRNISNVTVYMWCKKYNKSNRQISVIRKWRKGHWVTYSGIKKWVKGCYFAYRTKL